MNTSQDNFVKPDVSHLPIPPEHYRAQGIVEIMEKHTRISPCVVEGEPDAHNAFLVVDGQSFCITALACDTKEEASWMCWQLAKALEKIKYDIGYSSQYDARYYMDTGEWIESACSDETCTYCSNRPVKATIMENEVAKPRRNAKRNGQGHSEEVPEAVDEGEISF